MNRLNLILIFVTGPVIAGLLLLPLVALDLFGWGASVIAAVTGFLLSWPTAWALDRWIKSYGVPKAPGNGRKKPRPPSEPRDA